MSYWETGFRQKLDEIRAEIGQLQRIDGILQGACKHNGKVMELFNMSVTEPVIKEIPEMRVVSKREKRELWQTHWKANRRNLCLRWQPENQRNRVKVTGPSMFLYHDEEYKETDADIEIALSVWQSCSGRSVRWK